jgi:hypothetical protein
VRPGIHAGCRLTAAVRLKGLRFESARRLERSTRRSAWSGTASDPTPAVTGEDDRLRLKLLLVIVIAVLTGLHALAPRSRAVSVAVLLGSLGIVRLGVKLSHD